MSHFNTITMKNNILYIFIISVFLTSCEESATDIVQPGTIVEEVAFQTVEDLQLGLNGVYNAYNPHSEIRYNAIFTDNAKRGLASNGQQQDIFNFNINSNTGAASACWTNRYSTINFAFNGGLRSDSLFLQNASEINTPLSFNVNTPEANTSGYRTSLTNEFRFYRNKNTNNVLNDSIERTDTIKKGFLYVDNEFLQESQLYKDQNPDFSYYNILDSSGLSVLNVGLYNRDFATSVGYKSHSLNILLGSLRYSLALNNQILTWGSLNRKQESFVNTISGSFIYSKNESELLVNASFGLTGVLSNNRSAVIHFTQKINETSGVEVLLEASQKLPSLFLSRFSSPVLDINTTWETIDEVSAKLALQTGGLRLELQHRSIQNLLYLNEQYRPISSNGITYLNQIELRHNLKTNRLGLDYSIAYQAIGGVNIIRLPEFIGQLDFYVDGSLFEDVLKTRLGLQATYFSKFRNNGYFAPLNMFYVQNGTEQGKYPFVNVYGKFNVKSVLIYVGALHSYAGLIGSNYFLRPGMPAQGFMYRIGFRWYLIN